VKMRRKLVLIAGAAAVATAIGVSPAGSALAGLLMTGPPEGHPNAGAASPRPIRVPPAADNPNPVDPGTPSRSGPTLDQSQVDTATAIVNADPFLKGLTRGNRYTVTNAVPWTDPGTDEVMGTELTLALAGPVTASTVLPGIRYDVQGSSYQRLQLHARVENATALTVLVDFRSNAVVSVAPDDAAVVTELPGNVHFPASGED